MDTTAAETGEAAEAARIARTSQVVDRAVALAKWVGTGRYAVTARGALRKADAQAAGAAIGAVVPEKLRTMADLPSLSRPWHAGVGCGLLAVSGGSVTAGPALEHWPADDSALLDGWLAGLRAACAAESEPQREDSALMLAMALLTVFGDASRPARASLRYQANEALWELAESTGRYDDPLTGVRGNSEDGKQALDVVTALLAGFGAVSQGPDGPVTTPLGRWAGARLAAALPQQVRKSLPAAEMIAEAARFTDTDEQNNVARGWLASRKPAKAVREVLAAAEGMSALHRSVAVGVLQQLGDDSIPAWREYLSAPNVGPHARAVLAGWIGGPDPAIADQDWLVAEAAAAALQGKGADEALTIVWEGMPGTDLDACLAEVAATGHPDAAWVCREVGEFAASGAPVTISQVAELKISLSSVRPPPWRRVLFPVTASLADLHETIQRLFGWDGDHLHVFTAGSKRYSDPFMPLEETGNECAVRLHEVLAPGGKLAYTYDLGDCWEHDIEFERVVPRDPDLTYPVCTAHKGDSPVEYWSEEDPEEPEPFDLDQMNERLAAFGEGEG